MDYDVDVSSQKRGGLTRDIEARGHYMGFEAGRRMAYGEKLTLTPRAWAERRSFSGEGFTDAMDSRISRGYRGWGVFSGCGIFVVC